MVNLHHVLPMGAHTWLSFQACSGREVGSQRMPRCLNSPYLQVPAQLPATVQAHAGSMSLTDWKPESLVVCAQVGVGVCIPFQLHLAMPTKPPLLKSSFVSFREQGLYGKYTSQTIHSRIEIQSLFLTVVPSFWNNSLGVPPTREEERNRLFS